MKKKSIGLMLILVMVLSSCGNNIDVQNNSDIETTENKETEESQIETETEENNTAIEPIIREDTYYRYEYDGLGICDNMNWYSLEASEDTYQYINNWINESWFDAETNSLELVIDPFFINGRSYSVCTAYEGIDGFYVIWKYQDSDEKYVSKCMDFWEESTGEVTIAMCDGIDFLAVQGVDVSGFTRTDIDVYTVQRFDVEYGNEVVMEDNTNVNDNVTSQNIEPEYSEEMMFALATPYIDQRIQDSIHAGKVYEFKKWEKAWISNDVFGKRMYVGFDVFFPERGLHEYMIIQLHQEYNGNWVD